MRPCCAGPACADPTMELGRRPIIEVKAPLPGTVTKPAPRPALAATRKPAAASTGPMAASVSSSPSTHSSPRPEPRLDEHITTGVLRTYAELTNTSEPATFTAIAEYAFLARATLYRDDQLRAVIHQHPIRQAEGSPLTWEPKI